MDSITLVALAIGLIIVVAIFAVAARKRARRRSEALREHFGPEYDRALEQHGDRARGEKELLSRQRRFEKLNIQPLSREQCERFSAAWGHVQQRFVDDPSGAVTEAHGLVKDVMKTRGYPLGDFEQRVADLSVEHANVVDHYRAARKLAAAREQGEVSTEDLRQAMVHYRELFHDLLQSAAPAASAAQLREAHV